MPVRGDRFAWHRIRSCLAGSPWYYYGGPGFGRFKVGWKGVPRRPAILVLWLVSVVLLVSLAWISHAALRDCNNQPVADALHLCAAGLWIGGLVPLLICLTQASVSSR